MRPFIVFFGEDVPNMTKSIEEVRSCDVFVIIGTSMQVYPAASLVEHVRYDYPVIYIDPNPQLNDYMFYWDTQVIKKSATEGMKELLTNWNNYIKESV